MDSLLTAAARALAAGDPLGALKRVALRDDASALALRGIAMAQLGDYERSRQLLRRAARRFGPGERLAHARCQVAEAEVALAVRDLHHTDRGLAAAARVLAVHGDHANAVHAHLLAARFQLLVGEIDAATRTLSAIGTIAVSLPGALAARAELTRAELALRQIRAGEARIALDRAAAAARGTRISALMGEVERVRRALSEPSARLIRAGEARLLRLDEVEALFASGGVIVDGGRRAVRQGRREIRLEGRPVLFALLRVLAEAWPDDVARDRLIREAFTARVLHPSHRARLRVELSRLRRLLRPMLAVESTASGFRLRAQGRRSVGVLAPPIDGPAGAVQALLADGESWSTSALARALGWSQRTVQRTLGELEAGGAVRAVGAGRSRGWLAPALSGFATTLLLPGSLALG